MISRRGSGREPPRAADDVGPAAVAANAAEPSIHDAVKASIERKDVYKTDMVGWGMMKNAYRDAGRDGIDESIHAVRREPVQVRLRRSLEGRLVPELGERPVPQAIENHEEDFPCIHFGRRRSGP